MFAAVEQPALRPLPAAPFVLATWSTARVGPDIHAKVGGTLYSLPWRYLGDRVDARSTPTMVQFFHHGQLIKTHPRKDRGKQTDLGDYPPEKIAFHMRTPTWCRHRAAEIGPACVAVIDELLAENALFRLRAAQGVLGLADKHDPARLEAACAVATSAGDPSYRTIKGILAAGTETRPATRPTGDGGAAAHLHGPRPAVRRPDRPPSPADAVAERRSPCRPSPRADDTQDRLMTRHPTDHRPTHRHDRSRPTSTGSAVTITEIAEFLQQLRALSRPDADRRSQPRDAGDATAERAAFAGPQGRPVRPDRRRSTPASSRPSPPTPSRPPAHPT